MKTIDVTALQAQIQLGFIEVQKHAEAELFIYNYTQLAQFENVWNEMTLQCRGLILDDKGNVVARPFGKFFNLGEQENQRIPATDFEVYEKMDGSLGILYWHDNQPYIATRGSFHSVQAQKANEMLQKQYAHILPQLNPAFTYLFEIIYPENRIVVNYGEREELVLLGVIETQTGIEQPLVDVGFPMVKKWEGLSDIYALKTLAEDNREGFVIKFADGLRYKVKFEEYVRIHRIVTRVSSLSIWEFLLSGQEMGELLERVPDEFFQWVKLTHDQLWAQFYAIEAEAKAEFKVLESRKETALYFQTCKYPSILFGMLDNKNYAPTIWRMIRPTYAKPFSNMEVQ